ncbi:MAG: YqgE/AlgH family protein [Verrucomicrobiota bacterium JB022]|nr:YqgE/AlgH family protein [Verrucomicrobiota bacterium JB022]
MRDINISGPSLRGNLLVAHPSLLDPNFQRSVVLLSAHTEEDGALGVIINRPLDKTLGDVRTEVSEGVLSEIPLYEGGPVATDQIILVAWKWDMVEATFQLYFGVADETLQEMMAEEPNLIVRAFVGYSGWSGGQMEDELKEKAWLVAPIRKDYLDEEEEQIWRHILKHEDPKLAFFADAPDDPSLN